MLLAPSANRSSILYPDRTTPENLICMGDCERMGDKGEEDFERIEFYEDPTRFPEWMDWREWRRLDRDDLRYKEFRSVLSDIYNPDSPHSRLFTNSAPELFDCINNLVGRDNKYLYVYDWCPKRFVIKEKSQDVFTYESDGGKFRTKVYLFELNVSEEHPLYAIPRRMERKNYGNSMFNRLPEIMTDSENITNVYIIHSKCSSFPHLVLPTYGVSL